MADDSKNTEALNILAGASLGALAGIVRYASGLDVNSAPFGFATIAILIAATVSGLTGGLAALIVGGLLTWYLVLPPAFSFVTDSRADTYVVIYFTIGTMILVFGEMYRRAEARRHVGKLAEAHRAIEDQQILTKEMNHRVKNILALTQAIANQTFRGNNTGLEKFGNRLRTLADAQSVLVNQGYRPVASVRDLVSISTQPLSNGTNFELSGPEAHLRDQEALMLSLALHELATNAVKYGALSVPEGRVRIIWTVEGHNLVLSWHEENGPAVVSPEAQGFGSKLLAMTRAKVTYEPTGLTASIIQKLA